MEGRKEAVILKNRKKSVGFLGPEAAASPWLPQLLALRWAVEGPTASVLAACQPQKISPIPWLQIPARCQRCPYL